MEENSWDLVARIECVPSVQEMSPRSSGREGARRALVSRPVTPVDNWSLPDHSKSLGARSSMLYDRQGGQGI